MGEMDADDIKFEPVSSANSAIVGIIGIIGGVDDYAMAIHRVFWPIFWPKDLRKRRSHRQGMTRRRKRELIGAMRKTI